MLTSTDLAAASAVIGAISATAAWRSSLVASRSTTSSQFAYVWPAIYQDKDVRVRFFNDGPGTAIQPACRLIEKGKAGEAVKWEAPLIRALGSGEARPGEEIEALLVDADVDPKLSWFEVRWTDGRGRRWTLKEPLVQPALIDPPHRLRQRRWELWRSASDW